MSAIEVFVCPDCGEWHSDTANGYPLYSGCEHFGHREAVRVVYVPERECDRYEKALRRIAGLNMPYRDFFRSARSIANDALRKVAA